MSRVSLAALLVCALAITGAAQTQILPTTFAAGNGQSGNMFDLVAVGGVPITIQSFDIHIGTGITDTIEVYALTTPGSYVGNEANAGAWTLLASTTVTSAGTGVGTPLNLTLNHTIAPGTTQAFYVTCTTSTMNYTNGTVEGTSFANDGFLDFLEGIGVPYAFAGTFRPRVWNGNIHYTFSSLAPSYQVNSRASSLDIDGVMSTGYAPAVTTTPDCLAATINIGSNLPGTAFETVYNLAPQAALGAPGSLSTANGQIVNVDLTQPTTAFLNGGATLVFAPFGGALSLPVQAPNGFVLSGQVAMVDPSNPDGIALSQAATYEPAPPPTVTGPTGDDSFVNVDLRNGLCAVNDFTFYGTVYSTIDVNSNGRVTFGGGDTDFSATVAEALGDNPQIGAWTDFNPGGAPVIGISTDPNTFEVVVDYGTPAAGLNYFGGTTPNSFQVRLDVVTGVATLNGLQGLTDNAGNMFLGISGGNVVGATDSGAATYNSVAGVTTNSTDMIYEFGTPGPNGSMSTSLIGGGINMIQFIPNGLGNYDWLAL